MSAVPKWWLEDLPPDVQPLMEEFLLGLVALPPEVSEQVSDMFHDDATDLAEIGRLLFRDHEANGSDPRALLALVKLIAHARSGQEH